MAQAVLQHSGPFCRDCLADVDGPSAASARLRCAACGSPRVARHLELHDLAIGHIDCDAFYAAVEKRDRPELKDRPVIIGGGQRGVVSTACYLARIKGVRSAMPMFKATALCPDAVIIKPDMAKYVAVGREVRTRMLALTPMVEPISIDEAFLDLSGTERLHKASPATQLARLARDIERDIGITVSVGLSYCKFLAKIASDLDKPKGFSVVGRAEAKAFLATLPVRKIWGVGPAFEATLLKEGHETIADLQASDLNTLMARYGQMGSRLYHLARGEDDRRVQPRSETKSVSGETTFDRDLTLARDLVPALRALSEEVSARLKKSDIAGRTVTLKLKSADFRLRTRSAQLGEATQLADRIFRLGQSLLLPELDGTPFRLIGIGVSDLGDPTHADQPDLVDIDSEKRAKAERAMDTLKAKWGARVVETGYTFGRGKRGRKTEKSPD